jgi:hypothetical protein
MNFFNKIFKRKIKEAEEAQVAPSLPPEADFSLPASQLERYRLLKQQNLVNRYIAQHVFDRIEGRDYGEWDKHKYVPQFSEYCLRCNAPLGSEGKPCVILEPLFDQQRNILFFMAEMTKMNYQTVIWTFPEKDQAEHLNKNLPLHRVIISVPIDDTEYKDFVAVSYALEESFQIALHALAEYRHTAKKAEEELLNNLKKEG